MFSSHLNSIANHIALYWLAGLIVAMGFFKSNLFKLITTHIDLWLIVNLHNNLFGYIDASGNMVYEVCEPEEEVEVEAAAAASEPDAPKVARAVDASGSRAVKIFLTMRRRRDAPRAGRGRSSRAAGATRRSGGSSWRSSRAGRT